MGVRLNTVLLSVPAFRYSLFINKYHSVSVVVYAARAHQAFVSAGVPVCQVLGSECQIVQSLVKPRHYEWTEQTAEKKGET